LNEVGGNPAAFGGTVAQFHNINQRRRSGMPHTLLATSTHDTKLGEDARVRLYVLSELPDQWATWVAEWHEMNRHHKTWIEGRLAPDANEEYRFYQTLLACWPAEPFEPDDAFRQRIREHMRKAINEAKRNTHWINPNEPWMEAFDRFVVAVLSAQSGGKFLASFRPRADRLAHLGAIASLAQLVLKITSPGVPDFYQGTELWSLTLVDPDNRRLVEWDGREALAGSVRDVAWHELLRRWRDGTVKFRLMLELLQFRREHLAVFQQGDYTPMEATGRFAERVVLFRRTLGRESVVVVVPRLTAMLGCPPLGLVWEDTQFELPPAREWRNVLTGETVTAGPLAIANLFAELPVAVLAAG
jgi:(1->4)-alpha-D-glucan 1-alpha-D-glucosylmutase